MSIEMRHGPKGHHPPEIVLSPDRHQRFEFVHLWEPAYGPVR
jgi:hypothetical protein